MVRTIMLFSLGLLIILPGTSAEECLWQSKPYGTDRPIPRAFFASAHDYHHDTENNKLYVHGGIGPAGSTMDPDGALWYTTLHNEGNWEKLVPVGMFGIPPARSYMDAVIVPQNLTELNSNTIKRFIHFVTFGGLNAGGVPSNDLWICTKVFTDFAHFGSDCHWRWLHASQSGDVPGARSQHRMVYIPPTESEPGFRIFLAGGVDANGDPLEDAYIGTLTWTLTASQGNPWSYSLTASCVWEDINLDTASIANVGLYGHTAVFDPYYDDRNQPGAHPRVILYGGYDESDDLTDVMVSYDLVDEEWVEIPPENKAPEPHAYHVCILDPREDCLIVQGGRDERGGVDDDMYFFDLTTLEWSTYIGTGSPRRYGHAACCYWFTVFGGLEEDSSYNENLMDDILEFKPEEPYKKWTIEPESVYGLDNPASVLDTQRIKNGDWVEIHSGGADHFYECRFTVPYFIGHVTVEGVSHDGYRPAIFWPYSPVGIDAPLSQFLDDDMPLYESLSDYFRFGSSSYVIRDGAGITLRNLRIGHYDEEPGYPIPDAVLSDLEAVETSNDLLLRDPGILMNAPTQVEDCVLEGNIDGITMICVSSIPGFQEASVTDSVFENNYIGAVILETSHVFRNNRVKKSYLTGVMLEKGAHGRVHDNVFEGNGKEPDVAFSDWRSDILCSFDVTSRVPHIQTPLIYNNTFVASEDSYRCLAVTSHTQGMQYLNCPVFLNNILYHPDQGIEAAIYFQGSRSRIRAHANTFYCNSKWLSLASRSTACVDDIGDEDPLFASVSTSDYHLGSASPSINAGYYSLFPGITSEGVYSDYHLLDAGYHFSNDSPAVDPVTDLSADGDTISWTAPQPTPQGYLVIRTFGQEFILGVDYLSYLETTYSVDTEWLNLGLWFGISAFSSSGQFSTPAFIQM